MHNKGSSPFLTSHHIEASNPNYQALTGQELRTTMAGSMPSIEKLGALGQSLLRSSEYYAAQNGVADELDYQIIRRNSSQLANPLL